MGKSFTIILPFLYREDLLEANMLSIKPEHRANMIVVDNSPTGSCKQFEKLGVEILYHPENLGAARSWNIGLKRETDYTIIMSRSVRFKNSSSDLIDQLNEREPGNWVVNGIGWHCAIIHKSTVEKIGYFDENFYPCYGEDTDYRYRMMVSGIPLPYIDVEMVCAGYCITQSAESGMKLNMQAIFDYYTEKWGDDCANPGGKEKWELPFNGKSIDYWPVHTIDELKVKYGLV